MSANKGATPERTARIGFVGSLDAPGPNITVARTYDIIRCDADAVFYYAFQYQYYYVGLLHSYDEFYMPYKCLQKPRAVNSRPRAGSNRRRRRTSYTIHSKENYKWMKEDLETWNAGAGIDPTAKKESPNVEERSVKRRKERMTERKRAEEKRKKENVLRAPLTTPGTVGMLAAVLVQDTTRANPSKHSF
ncbi:hypothetical protein B0H13DRAFT_1861051 [Mycena leptocephala]|nr:hypothetical protein B0H13DRAFT_1861051 [Mycena leptocephala]